MSNAEPTTATGTRRLGFTSTDYETRVDELPVRGQIPSWLTGSVIRVTPAQFDIGGGSVGHWFDGLGMLNAFSFSSGTVSYASRLQDTEAHRAARRGRYYPGVSMATDPCRYLGQRLTMVFDRSELGTPNVNVARLGDRYLAATESSAPLEFDPDSLETRGFVDLRDSIRDFHGSFAHPHFDLDTGEMLTYITRISAPNQHRIVAIEPNTLKRRQIATVPATRNPSYMHSFALTENFIVLTMQPLSYSLPDILRSGKFQDGYRWHPERGTHFAVIDRRTGRLLGRHQAEPFFYWHHANAFEQDGEIVLDVVASDSPESVWDLDLAKLRDPAHRPAFYGNLRRYRIPLRGGPAWGTTVSDLRMEFPQFNYGANQGRDYRFVYGIAYRGTESDWFDQIVKIDVGDGSAKTWHEEGCYPSEPMFAQAPGGDGEDAGVVLNIVLDSRAGRSFLLVLDGATFQELGRAEVPHHIPFNFHQQYFA